MISKDVENGLIPFWYGSTYGTTYTNATDATHEIYSICK